MLALREVASPDLPRLTSSSASFTSPRSGPRLGGGWAGSFECSATGVMSADSLRATEVGRGRGTGTAFVPASERVANHPAAVARPRAEPTRVADFFNTGDRCKSPALEPG